MTETKQRRKPRKYTDEFKQQLADLYRSGGRRCDICREYDISRSLFDKWVKQAADSGSFHEKDNRTPEQEELIRLRKQLQQLKMENGILKQAALVLGRKQMWSGQMPANTLYQQCAASCRQIEALIITKHKKTGSRNRRIFQPG